MTVPAEQAARTAHRLALEAEALRAEGITTRAGLARALCDTGLGDIIQQAKVPII
jgi:hypothetical protein